MKQGSLFKMPEMPKPRKTEKPVAADPIGDFFKQEGFNPVALEHMEQFNSLYENLPLPILYNHSFHYVHSYFQGVKKAYFIHNEHEFIVVAQKYTSKPQFMIHCPIASYNRILNLIAMLQPFSEKPVHIIDLNRPHMEMLTRKEPEIWDIIKDGKDIIFDLKKCVELHGKKFRGIRNGINQFTKKHKYHIDVIDTEKVAEDAVRVIDDWKNKQGAKYFRVTVGRDKELFRRMWKVVDGINTFGIVVYNESGHPIACTMAARSPKDPTMGFEITTKCDIDYPGLTDFISHEIFKQMYAAGMEYSNEAGIYSPGTKANKNKWQPVDEYEMFKICLKK